MLNTMNEKKTNKLIEFKIVRSSLFQNPKTSHSFAKEKKKEENSKEDKIMMKTHNLNSDKNINKNVYFKLLSTSDDTIFLKKTKKSEEIRGEHCGEKKTKGLLLKRKRNTSTNTRCSVEDDRVLDYDRFLEELTSHKEERKHCDRVCEINCERSNKSNIRSFKLASNKKKATVEKSTEKLDTKIKKKIKKKCSAKRSSNVYDIDNFIIQNNAIRIHQKHEKLDIPIPVYKEISLGEEEIEKFDEEEENISDEVYLSHHQIYEKREREYCLSFYKKKKEKEKDHLTLSGVSLSDNITAKSNEETLNSNMKIRINFNIVSNGKVKI